MDKKIKTLRTFFRVSNAAFEFQKSIQSAFSEHIEPSKMHQLHKLALVEIEKETPDLALIDNLLAEMENTAEQSSDFDCYICENCGRMRNDKPCIVCGID